MNLWHLTRLDDDPEVHKHRDYDSSYAFVIRAPGHKSARKMARAKYKEDRWLDPMLTRCRLLASDVKGKPGIICHDFLNG
jgi:hypothetical protein